MAHFPQIVSCDCGVVKYEALSGPILTAVCYCTDCQAAAEIISKIDGVKTFYEADGGTPYVTLRDKHWKAISGADTLKSFKLNPRSPTTRFVASCCQTPLFVKYKRGFWTSTYRMRYTDPPPLEWRNNTASRKSERPFPDDIPRYETFPLRLFWRLFKARIF